MAVTVLHDLILPIPDLVTRNPVIVAYSTNVTNPLLTVHDQINDVRGIPLPQHHLPTMSKMLDTVIRVMHELGPHGFKTSLPHEDNPTTLKTKPKIKWLRIFKEWVVRS